LPVETYRDTILFLETSEEMPDAEYVYRVLVGMGERGLLEQFAGVLVARPKAWSLNRQNTPEEKARYTVEQEEAMRKALNEYNPGAVAVLGVDFGHTDPQLVVPSGGNVRIDGVEKRVLVTY
jgi:muramoyltetrapeptide carboxypeptidase LdcA involved in peptidoglycan recycling